jgi:hypothetical protein
MMANYGRIDDDMFETCIKSFFSVTEGARIVVVSDTDPRDKWLEYPISWRIGAEENIKDQMQFAKTQAAIEFCENLNKDDRFILADTDLYFLKDPFRAFDEREFNIGVTSRMHSYMCHVDINGGMLFVRPGPETVAIMKKEWEKYLEYDKNNRNWHIGQGYFNSLYKDGYATDVGWYWNYCPSTSYFGYSKAADMLKRAYETESVAVLHLKDKAKYLIYDGFLEHAVNDYWKEKGHSTLACGNFR